MTYHTTRERAVRQLTNEGYAWERGAIMGAGCYRGPDRKRAYIEEAKYRSFDMHGKNWFMVLRYPA